MAAENQSLLAFIDAAKSQGASDEFVVALLRQNGWSEKRIYQAFGTRYETCTGMPVPNGGGRIEAAKDAFLYLLAFITLGIWAVELGALLFASIDRAFPNPTLGYTNAAWVNRSISTELASTIVAFPLFLFVTRSIVRGIGQQPERFESSVREWLTYIALVITATTVIGDVVTFLAYFLRGDLNPRFVLKVVSVLVIAGGIFVYYLDSMRREKLSSARNLLFAISALAIVGFGVVLGFIQVGSPAAQRSMSEDTRRLFDLSSLAQGLHLSWQAHAKDEFVLPATIENLPAVPTEPDASIRDPVTGRPYTYAPLQGPTYRLCATFAHPSPAGVPRPWQHAAGNACFALDAREDQGIVQREW
jgi:hypothetical protein